MTTLLQMLMDNPRGWGNGPAPQEVAWQDDAGNLYGFDNKIIDKGPFPAQPQSWGETALNVATAPARIATAFAGSLSPYGADGWRVPPMAHEIADAISAPGRAYSEGMSPEEMQRTAASAAGFAMGGGGLAARPGVMAAANASKEAGAVGLGNAVAQDSAQPIRAYRGVRVGKHHASEYPNNQYWMTDDHNLASAYAMDEFNPFRFEAETPAVLPVSPDFKNPLTIDAGLNQWNEVPFEGTKTNTNAIAERAASRGHDGVIFKNVIDAPNAETPWATPSTVYAAISPGTVKSATTGETLFSNASPTGALGMLAPLIEAEQKKRGGK